MCDICTSAKNSSYLKEINAWFERDLKRLEKTKEFAKENSLLQNAIFTSVNWPIKITFPLFEARVAYAVPTNYFQNFFIDGERARGDWAHDATRAVSFVSNGLLLFSKFVFSRGGEEFLSHYALLLFKKGEYKLSLDEVGNINISANTEKLVKNLVTGKRERKKFSFNFLHKPTEHAMVSREQLLTSGKIREIYGKSLDAKFASAELEGYVITVPHFSPHPYMLNNFRDFGFSSRAEFQSRVIEYFRAHAEG